MNKDAVKGTFYMGSEMGGGNYSVKNVIEDFMKVEYQEGIRNEFNTMDALINKLPKDTITGKAKYKTFGLGITDNVRAVGPGTFDRYELSFNDFYGKGRETVEAKFDTTKLMAVFAITDEAILKGTGDGSLIDVLKDQFSNMEIGLKHTYNRYIYGGRDGIIGKITSNITLEDLTDLEGVDGTNATKDFSIDNRGVYHNMFYGNALPLVLDFSMTNSHSLIEGMGCMIEQRIYGTTAASNTDKIVKGKRYIGKIFQKDNSQIHSEKIQFVVEKVVEGALNTEGVFAWGTPADATSTNVTDITYVKPEYTSGANTVENATVIEVFSRQLDDAGAIAAEYQGLEDIVVRQNNYIFGVNRAFYKSLNCSQIDLNNTYYLNEETLRDMSDHLALTSPEDTGITIVSANHRIISSVEKAMYQFKNYNLDSTQNGVQLGGKGEIRFDNYVLSKDKYARDNNVYMLDQQKIGELVRRDFTWITSGEVNNVLQRRQGTELYEGIMNKYADMYIDAWKCHAVIKNCLVPSSTVGGWISYSNTDGSPKTGV